jgi:hypothetical protein
MSSFAICASVPGRCVDGVARGLTRYINIRPARTALGDVVGQTGLPRNGQPVSKRRRLPIRL